MNPGTRHARVVTMIRHIWSSANGPTGLNFAPHAGISTLWPGLIDPLIDSRTIGRPLSSTGNRYSFDGAAQEPLGRDG